MNSVRPFSHDAKTSKRSFPSHQKNLLLNPTVTSPTMHRGWLSSREWFVFQFAHSTMLFVMLIHSVCGSCWLQACECTCHDHVAVSADGGVHRAEHETEKPFLRGHHTHGESVQDRRADCQHPDHQCVCRRDRCVFLGAATVSVPTAFEYSHEIDALTVVHGPSPRLFNERLCGVRRTEPIGTGQWCAVFQVWRI